MPDAYMDVDTAVVVPMNIMPLVDDTDFKTLETAMVYNSTGIKVYWHFLTTAGAYTVVEIHPTTGGVHDISEPITDIGAYGIEIPASGGNHASNDTEGVGWISGLATGIYHFRGPTIGFRAAALNNALIDGGDTLDVNVTEWEGATAPAMTGDAYAKINELVDASGNWTGGIEGTVYNLPEILAALNDLLAMYADGDFIGDILGSVASVRDINVDASGNMTLTTDQAVMLSSVAVMVTTLLKHVTNELVHVDNGDGTVTVRLLDDEGIMPLLTWIYHKASKTRDKAT